jgi:hypothetical protein
MSLEVCWDGLWTLLGSHNFMVTALGSCVKWPLVLPSCVNLGRHDDPWSDGSHETAPKWLCWATLLGLLGPQEPTRVYKLNQRSRHCVTIRRSSRSWGRFIKKLKGFWCNKTHQSRWATKHVNYMCWFNKVLKLMCYVYQSGLLDLLVNFEVSRPHCLVVMQWLQDG